jgi:hypothetical protein
MIDDLALKLYTGITSSNNFEVKLGNNELFSKLINGEYHLFFTGIFSNLIDLKTHMKVSLNYYNYYKINTVNMTVWHFPYTNNIECYIQMLEDTNKLSFEHSNYSIMIIKQHDNYYNYQMSMRINSDQKNDENRNLLRYVVANLSEQLIIRYNSRYYRNCLIYLNEVFPIDICDIIMDYNITYKE